MIPEKFLSSKPSHIFLLYIRWLLTCLKPAPLESNLNVGEKKIPKQGTITSCGNATIQVDDNHGNDGYGLPRSHYGSGIILVNPVSPHT